MLEIIEDSPFHKGEQEIQEKLGVREKMERFGRQVIRDHMPEQHRHFYQQLPFVFVGHEDKNSWPWASILIGEPGFLKSPNAKTLNIDAQPVTGDPLLASLTESKKLGLLGIEFESRRRNRLSTHIKKVTDTSIELEIDQAFGNCPQYIQERNLELASPATLPPANKPGDFFELDDEAISLIKESDTFFVASVFSETKGHAAEGADISHRGGRLGFIKIDSDGNLTIPDYPGNSHFNTLGYFLENPKAGLLFLDFKKGHILTLTGTVEISWEAPDFFTGAERSWKFKLNHGRWLKDALPYRWKLKEFSPNSNMTGTWLEAEKLKQAEKVKNQWMPYIVTKVVSENSNVKSFYLKPKEHQQSKFLAGQFLTIKAKVLGETLIRTYTVSSAPCDEQYRITVKREKSTPKNIPDGKFSSYLHDEIKIGDQLTAKAPCGNFTFDNKVKRPVVFLAAGIGITPFVSMSKHALLEGFRTRKMRDITFFATFTNNASTVLFEEMNAISKASNGRIKNYWILSKADDSLIENNDHYLHGRIEADLLKSVLPIDDYDFYLCGPSGFMQSMYNMLRKLGVNDNRINAEEFGPASLTRDCNADIEPLKESAEQAIVKFENSMLTQHLVEPHIVEQQWSKEDGTLLEFAEKHGFTPESSCRRGQCGACKTKLISGDIIYNTKIAAALASDEILLCCALPAPDPEGKLPSIQISI